MNSVRGGALLTVATLFATLLAAPAHAERYRETDPAGDVVAGESSPAPERRHLDVRRVKVRHTEDRVVIRASMRALKVPRRKSRWYFLTGFIKVNPEAQPSESVAWTWEVEFTKASPRHGTRLFILDAEHQEQFGCDWVTHPGLNARANYQDDVVTVNIPRHCLALDDEEDVRPKWVRVSVTAISNASSPFYDSLGPEDGGWPELRSAQLTPRLYPGNPDDPGTKKPEETRTPETGSHRTCPAHGA